MIEKSEIGLIDNDASAPDRERNGIVNMNKRHVVVSSAEMR